MSTAGLGPGFRRRSTPGATKTLAAATPIWAPAPGAVPSEDVLLAPMKIPPPGSKSSAVLPVTIVFEVSSGRVV